MTYDRIHAGVFQARPNRFIALVDLEGETRRCHVPNTGRLRELLLPGVRAWCQFHPEPGRKTAWTLIAVERDGVVVNLDSQAPNPIETFTFDFPDEALFFVKNYLQTLLSAA